MPFVAAWVSNYFSASNHVHLFDVNLSGPPVTPPPLSLVPKVMVALVLAGIKIAGCMLTFIS